MAYVEEIKETLREHRYSDRAIAEILKWYVNNSQAGNKKAGYRSWMDVVECILEKTIGGSTKTHVIRRCNLTSDKFQVYLDFLLSWGFIREVEQGIETTEKGLAFLRDYRRLGTFLQR
jgi:predicted transcriptional regulator